MRTIRGNYNITIFFRKACIVLLWCIAFYSSIIQNKYYQIPYAMLIIGGAILFCFIMANTEKPFVFHEALTEENVYMFVFMVYIFLAGMLFSPDRNSHLSQWITCMEYLFIQIVITAIIKDTGTDTFHTLLLAVSVVFAIILLQNPIEYHGSGRYSISENLNPNGLGMGFVAGIWAVFYLQSKSKLPIIISGALVAILGYCILLTGSRKSLIAAALAVIVWFFFCFLPSLRGKDVERGILSFALTLILVIVIAWKFMSIYADTTIATRMENLLYETSEGNRSSMYREGYELFKRNPLFGIGFQGFWFYLGSYSHATLVEIPVSGGILGTILYFGTYFFSFRKIIYIYKRTRIKRDLYEEYSQIKMIILLWVVMIFFTTCIIHPYQFDSSILFGIIFGETANIKNRIEVKQAIKSMKKSRSRYIRNE